MSLRSGSMPLAPDRDRCRVVARFPYPQGIRPINADPLDSFEVGKERRESSVRGMHMRARNSGATTWFGSLRRPSLGMLDLVPESTAWQAARPCAGTRFRR